jgi:hypothetical protein
VVVHLNSFLITGLLTDLELMLLATLSLVTVVEQHKVHEVQQVENLVLHEKKAYSDSQEVLHKKGTFIVIMY